MTPLDIAVAYLGRGWAPVPIPFGQKGPKGSDWQHYIITRENARDYFTGKQNIGVQLGPKSGGLCDVDLDCPEAVALAPTFLPATQSVFGRKSKPRSHYLYRIGDPEPKATLRLEDVEKFPPDEKPTIIELRMGGGGKGAQTLFPGSKHPSGELIEWAQEGEPAQSNCGALKSAITKIALAVMVARRWKKSGRHEAALRVAGFLARAGWSQDEIVHLIEAVAQAAGDDELSDRRKAAIDACEAHANGKNTYGLPSLKEHFGDKVAERLAALLSYREVDTDATLERMNNRYCVVPYGGKVRVLTFEHDGRREVPTFYSAADFRFLHSNQLVPVAGKKEPVQLGHWWIHHKDRRQYEGVIFAPGKPAVIDGRLFNLWRGWGTDPHKGNWPLLRQHVETILAGGNKEHAAYIFNWTAWTLQNPGEPPEVALAFRGGKGTGKGLFGRALLRAFGQHGLHISSHSHLTGNFNRHLQDCALLFADEAFWPGDKSAEGTLKRIITEPTLLIEPKGVDAREEKNRLHIVIAANENWVVPASIDERRFAMFNVSEAKKQDREYFAPLYKEMDDGGVGAMMYDLIDRDLEGWHPRDDVPRTDALIEQIHRSLKAEDQWWVGLLERGALPMADKQNPRRAPSGALLDHARRTVKAFEYATEHILGPILLRRGCRKVKVAGRRGWEFPPLAEARKDWAERLATEWGDDLNDWSHLPDDDWL